MKYENVIPAIFLSRPNRFIAEIEIDGKKELCHVKNTGRCRELLTEGARIFVQKSDNPERKTKFDLIVSQKNGMLINMDSQAPNKVFHEWMNEGNFFKNIKYIKPECKFGNSRFDFYLETDEKKIFAEIKGVTLEENGIAMFPDAPTERGLKHINELTDAVRLGYESYIFFIIQMEKCRFFVPNRKTHPEFADTLKSAGKSGVKVKALSCFVSPDELRINSFVNIHDI